VEVEVVVVAMAGRGEIVRPALAVRFSYKMPLHATYILFQCFRF
jgi:hypothetical protein